jgi:hypothetical protein
MSPAFGPTSQQIRPQQPLRPQFNPPPPRPSLATPAYPSSASTINSATSAPSSAGANTNQPPNPNTFYSSPFQSHYDQLGKSNQWHNSKTTSLTDLVTEQEYDQGDEMYDDQDPDEHQQAGAGAYSNNFAIPVHNMQQQHPPGNQQQLATNGAHQPLQPQPPHADAAATFGAPINAGYDSYDPMLDSDPFGLTASMHFPTQFSFDATSR